MKTAYPQVLGTCSITLYSNVPFDNTYANHSLISKKFLYNNSAVFTGADSLVPCEMFLNRKNPNILGSPRYYPSYTLTGDFNFNFSNGLIGSITLELTAEQTNANYLKLVTGSDVYYYFITGINQVNFETYTLSLELDVLMTYQDEFLEGMKDMPVFTQRKMCYRYTNNGLYPHCADYKTGESTFAGVKPSIVKTKIAPTFKSKINKLEGVKWLTCCFDDIQEPQLISQLGNVNYKFDDKDFPLMMVCMPIGVNSITFKNGSDTFTITDTMMHDFVSNLIDNGKVHACKVSPYPPFDADSNLTITQSGTDYTLTSSLFNFFSVSGNNFIEYDNLKTTIYVAQQSGVIVITNEKKHDYEFGNCYLDTYNSQAPNPLMPRFKEPKLFFEPFRKYLLTSSYGEGNEFFPELIYSDGVYLSSHIPFSSAYTFYIGDYNVVTYQNEITDANSNKFYSNYKVCNIGLSCNINYVVPCGTDALAVFNLTQSQSYYTSKIASGVTAGLSIAGGVASIGVGVVSENPMLIAGGATAIAGGIAGAINTIKSTNAKIEDLKNTPDSINVQGGCFTSDMNRANPLPYVIIYECSKVIQEQATDFFYNYGYEVARECYFNLELKQDFDTSGDVDTNLFSRDIFNYIKLNEDITNKINANIPLIVKQKLSKIFNDGITLWSWFGHDELWKNGTPYLNQDYWLDRWFLKCQLDNTEISLWS